jgi:lysozyme
MKTSPVGLNLISRFEGFSATPYLCPAGLLTIGYGHVVRSQEEKTLLHVDVPQAEQLLMHDVANVERALGRLITVPLRQSQFDALVSFTFNVGTAALQRSTMRRVINREEHEAVTDQLMRWVWAGGRKLAGLMQRRRAEAQLYSS